MTLPHTDCLVETDWLAQHLDAPDVIVVDGTWYLPTSDRDARGEFEESRIPGAIFLDIDAVRDTASPLPHMLPSTVAFSSAMKKLGIGNGSRVIVYDRHGLYSAPRVWWMLKIMGHSDVRVLNGGFPKWLAEERAVDTDPPTLRAEVHFMPQFDNALVCDIDDVRKAMKSDTSQIVDARPEARFTGAEDEPRPGLRRGHIPGSLNVPHDALVNEDGTLKSNEAIREVFAAAGVDPHQKVVAMCGSGVTSAVVTLALAQIGVTNSAVYDGSFAEWGQPNGLPVAIGPVR